MITLNHYMLELRFLNPVLGSTPLDPEIYTKFILSKNEDEANCLRKEEIEVLQATAEWLGLQMKDGMTDELRDDLMKLQNASHGFFRRDGQPYLACWVLKGFFKEAAGHLRKDPKSYSSTIYTYKKVINLGVHLREQFVPMEFAGETDWYERPLRAETAQGERIALLRSERAPAGSKVLPFMFTLVGGVIPIGTLREWLDFGQFQGLGQWRNGAWGRFEYALTPVDVKGKQIGEMMFTRSLEEWEAGIGDGAPPKPKRTYTRKKKVAEVEEEPEVKPAITKRQAVKLTKSVMRRSARQGKLVEIDGADNEEGPEEEPVQKTQKVKYPREV